MTKDERLKLFDEALAGVRQTQAEYTGNLPVLSSIINQLLYLKAVTLDQESGDRLGQIVLGVQTAREIDGWKNDLADTLFDVAAQVDVMKTELALKGVNVVSDHSNA